MAFGTGNHETTRLCVRRLLDARDEWGGAVAEKRVIDAGCGSGILAISARKLGFEDIFAFDNDPESVRISRDNEILCGIKGSIDFKWADLNDGLKGTPGDLVLANILADILIDHAHILCGAVRPGGRLVLSGILARELDGVHAAFAADIAKRTGIAPARDARVDGEWGDLCYRF
jgi:ribosomal protein L11 methyltransferase